MKISADAIPPALPGLAPRSVIFSWPFAFALAFLFLPSAIRYLLGTSSGTPGLVAVCLLVCGGDALRGGFASGSNARRLLVASLVLAFALVAHLMIAVYLPLVPQDFDISRSALSLVALVFAGATAGVVADWFMRADSHELDRMGFLIRILLVLIAIWCFFGLQPPSRLDLTRPSFPFTEPSHFALVATPFIIDGCVRTTLPKRVAWLMVWAGLGLLNQSFSLVIVVLVAASVSLPIIYVAIAAIPVLLIAAGLDLQYYLDRLDFSNNSTNLSSLIYRQGWELVDQGMHYSKGWGVGFQQLGFASLNAPTSDLIYRLLGDDNNLRDGSFLAAKLMSEFGVIGIVLAGLVLIAAFNAALRLRAMIALPGAEQSANVRFMSAVTCGFIVEMFVRGIGYFSVTAILLIAALAFQWQIAARRRG